MPSHLAILRETLQASPILTHPLLLSNKLETLRSLCTMSLPCKYASPFSTWNMKIVLIFENA